MDDDDTDLCPYSLTSASIMWSAAIRVSEWMMASTTAAV